MFDPNKGTVTVKFSIGFGNNIFQYSFGRLLAQFHGLNYCHPAIPELGIQENIVPPNRHMKTIKIRKESGTGVYSRYFKEKTPNVNYDVKGHFEDYTLYQDHLDEIRSWFTKVKKRDDKDLIVHIRLQNRLVQLDHHMNFISGEGYANAVQYFDFNRLHIVTDAEKWDYYSEKDVKKIRQDILAGPNPGAEWVPIKDSIEYMKELVDAFKPYNPIIHCSSAETIERSGGLRDGFMDAFNLIRSFDQVLLYNSTFSWWAALLGNATKVGVFSLWKPGKEEFSPNLGETNYPGWFSWGDGEDLISNKKKDNPLYGKSWSERKRRSHFKRKIFKLKRKLGILT